MNQKRRIVTRLDLLAEKYQKTENEEEFEQIFYDIEEIIEGYARYYGKSRYLSYQQIFSELSFLLWKRILPKYDITKSSLRCFSDMCFKRKILAMKRHEKRKGAIPKNRTGSVEMFMIHSDKERMLVDPNNWYRNFENKDWINGVTLALRGILSPFESSVICLILHGHSYRETASMLSFKKEMVTAKMVDNALIRVKRKAQNYRGFEGIVNRRYSFSPNFEISG